MGTTRDIFVLLKINILKNSGFVLYFIIWFFVAPIILSFLAGWLQKIFLSMNFYNYFPTRESFWPLPFDFIALVIWIIWFIVLKELYERYEDWRKRTNKEYSFTEQSWKRDWIFNGKPKLYSNPLRLRVNSARAGCLLEKHLWKNFKMNFEMRFLDNYEKYIGLIFRAKDINNYFMLEIIQNSAEGVNKCFVKPHVRYSGMWEAMREDEIGSDFGSEWRKVSLKIFNNKATLIVQGLEEYNWYFPTHVDINHIESGVKEKQDVSMNKEEFVAKVTDLPKIDFVDSFGMIGFRAHLNQGAEIKALTVKEINIRNNMEGEVET